MESNVSKAQTEVWEWKNNLYEELKDIPRNLRLKYIKDKVRDVFEELQKEKIS
jgi:hypothetical protein